LEDAEDGKSHGQRPKNSKVPVNEDFLFDVDVMERELYPVYWLGPVYEGMKMKRQWTRFI
jgi:hypothetical protein